MFDDSGEYILIYIYITLYHLTIIISHHYTMKIRSFLRYTIILAGGVPMVDN